FFVPRIQGERSPIGSRGLLGVAHLRPDVAEIVVVLLLEVASRRFQGAVIGLVGFVHPAKLKEGIASVELQRGGPRELFGGRVELPQSFSIVALFVRLSAQLDGRVVLFEQTHRGRRAEIQQSRGKHQPNPAPAAAGHRPRSHVGLGREVRRAMPSNNMANPGAAKYWNRSSYITVSRLSMSLFCSWSMRETTWLIATPRGS